MIAHCQVFMKLFDKEYFFIYWEEEENGHTLRLPLFSDRNTQQERALSLHSYLKWHK